MAHVVPLLPLATCGRRPLCSKGARRGRPFNRSGVVERLAIGKQLTERLVGILRKVLDLRRATQRQRLAELATWRQGAPNHHPLALL